jgi:hypothetical protein
MNLLSQMNFSLQTIFTDSLMWFHGLENSDSHNLFQFIWLPFNIYLLIRLLRPSLRTDLLGNWASFILAAIIFVISSDPQSFLGIFDLIKVLPDAVAAEKLFNTFETFVHVLLLVKATIVVLELFAFCIKLLKVESIVNYVFKDSNLRLVLMAKKIVGYLMLYVILGALQQFLNERESITFNLISIWGVLSIPVYILCFVVAIVAMEKSHRIVFQEMLFQNHIKASADFEIYLSTVANRRMSAQLVINEIFMGQIMKLLLTALVTYMARNI